MIVFLTYPLGLGTWLGFTDAKVGRAGEWIGLVRFSAQGSAWLREEIERMRAEGLAETADMPLLLTRLAARHPVKLYVFSGHWLDVDTLPDVEYQNLLHENAATLIELITLRQLVQQLDDQYTAELKRN